MYILIVANALLYIATAARALELPNMQAATSNTKRALNGVTDIVGNTISSLLPRTTRSCPAVWYEISTTLTEQFLADGQCTDAARAAIRAAFHDCFNGACDGSLILADECSNSENAGLSRLCGNLGNLAIEKDVGVADLIQFAAAHAIRTCPGGPTVPVKIGRKDSATANPTGVLPQHTQSAGDLMKLFASKGFSAADLVALIGAHTAGKQFSTNSSASGASFDSSPGTWDNSFYKETRKGDAPFSLQSDRALAENLISSVPFSTFELSQAAWAAAFVHAMQKMSMLGVSGCDFVDCTSALPGGSYKREVKRANIFERMGW